MPEYQIDFGEYGNPRIQECDKPECKSDRIRECEVTRIPKCKMPKCHNVKWRE